MIAVCNTSPISNLIQIQRLPLLFEQFDQVLMPPEVAAELDAGKEFIGAWRAAPGATALTLRPASDRALVQELSANLHVGEAAAIALAVETAGAILILDESDGRRAATRIGLRLTGTLGLLIAAKRRGRIATIAPLIEELRTKARLWVAEDVVRRALQLAGE
jgi:predicted nucleic acid-binding protein